MPVEELSSLSAERSNERMIHSLHASARISRPPRMALPLSARATDVVEHKDEETEKRAPSDDHTESTAPATTKTKGLRSDDPRTVHSLVEGVAAAGDALYQYTTPEERTRLRCATAPSHASLQRVVYTNPASCIATTALLATAFGVLLAYLYTAPPAAPGYRAVGAASALSRRTVDRMVEYA